MGPGSAEASGSSPHRRHIRRGERLVLDFIYYPVSAILWFWHKVFGAIPFLGPAHGVTWALAVVFLVFTLRALLFKPFVSQVRSMRKMQEFGPQIRKLQEKHKGDRQRLAQEMQKLQSEHGFNPLGGCLPILIQIPVFIGLFHVLREFKTGKQSNYVFGADEVQSFLAADLFGTRLSAYITIAQHELADLETTRVATAIVAIPLMIAASIATHITARHSVERQSAAAAANPQSAIMNKLQLYIFPIGVLAGGPFFPIAILIYWLSNNLWTLGQQWVVYRKIDQEETTKQEQATAQRQALAPRPGQKPATPKKRPSSSSGADTSAGISAGSGANGSADAEAPSSAGDSQTPINGSPTSTDGKPQRPGSAKAASGEIPGMIRKPPRSKKSRKRR
jgi:YidC/Oxa1 family membrane protein insertase